MTTPDLVDTLDDPRLFPYLPTIYEKDRGWFREHGKLSAAAAKAVRTTDNELCAEARKDAAGLVDAFGISDALLGAPIAT